MDIRYFLQSLKGDDYDESTFTMLRLQGFKRKNDFVWENVREKTECIFHTSKSVGEEYPFIQRVEIKKEGEDLDVVTNPEPYKAKEKERPKRTYTKKAVSEDDLIERQKLYIDVAFMMVDNGYEFGRIGIQRFCDVMNTVCFLFPEYHKKMMRVLGMPKDYLFIPGNIQPYYNDIGIRGAGKNGCYEYLKMFRECVGKPGHMETEFEDVGYDIKDVVAKMKPWQIASALGLHKWFKLFGEDVKVCLKIKDSEWNEYDREITEESSNSLKNNDEAE